MGQEGQGSLEGRKLGIHREIQRMQAAVFSISARHGTSLSQVTMLPRSHSDRVSECWHWLSPPEQVDVAQDMGSAFG